MKLMYKPEKVISSFLAVSIVLTMALQPIGKRTIPANEPGISAYGVNFNEEDLPSEPDLPKPN